jgi:hypothetical protein
MDQARTVCLRPLKWQTPMLFDRPLVLSVRSFEERGTI